MTTHLTEPSPGDPISATLMRELIRTVRANRIIKGKNVLLGRGPNGTVVNVDVPRSGKSAAVDPLHPWKIYGKKETTDQTTGVTTPPLTVFVPDNSLIYDAAEIPPSQITGITPIGDDKYSLNAIYLIDETPATVWLRVLKITEDDSSGDPQTSTEFGVYVGDPTEDLIPGEKDLLYVVPLASVHVTEDDDGNKTGHVDLQYQHSAIVVGGSAPKAEAADVGCFKLDTYDAEEEGEKTACLKLLNTFIRIGGVWVAANGNESWETGIPVDFVKLKFWALVSTTVGSDGEPVFTTQAFENFALMKQDMLNPTKLVVPLYHFDSDGKVDVDFRVAPLADCFDIAEVNYTS